MRNDGDRWKAENARKHLDYLVQRCERGDLQQYNALGIP